MDVRCLPQLRIALVLLLAITVAASDATEIETVEGLGVVLDCPLEGQMHWFKVNTTGLVPLDLAGNEDLTMLADQSLSFRRVELYDEGVYACAASVNSTDFRETSLRVQVQPRLYTYGIPKQTSPGDTIYLTCAVSRIRGRPRDIYWQSTEGDRDVIQGRKTYDVIDAEYGVYSALTRLQLTLAETYHLQSLQCVLQTDDNTIHREKVHLNPCFGRYIRFPHTASLGAELAPSHVNTAETCGRQCEALNCTAFDFNRCNSRCYYWTDSRYSENVVTPILGVDQYRRDTDNCLAEQDFADGTVDTSLGGARIDPSLEFSVDNRVGVEGTALHATCSTGKIIPDDIFLQFEDNPLEKLVTTVVRKRIPNGLLIIASLNYTVQRSDEGRSIRCVHVLNGISSITAALKLRVCFHGYLSIETRRSPGGTLIGRDVTSSDPATCKQKCDTDAKCVAFEFNFCEQRCYKHSSRNSLAISSDPLDTQLHVKPVCLPDDPFYEELSDDDPANYDTLKLIIWASVCALLFLIVVLVSVIALCLYRKYRHPYNYDKGVSAPLKTRTASTRSVGMVSQNGGPSSGTSTYRPKRSSRLSLYADPPGPRYTSGLIPQKSEDSLYIRPYSTMPRLYDKSGRRAHNRQPADDCMLKPDHTNNNNAIMAMTL